MLSPGGLPTPFSPTTSPGATPAGSSGNSGTTTPNDGQGGYFVLGGGGGGMMLPRRARDGAGGRSPNKRGPGSPETPYPRGITEQSEPTASSSTTTTTAPSSIPPPPQPPTRRSASSRNASPAMGVYGRHGYFPSEVEGVGVGTGGRAGLPGLPRRGSSKPGVSPGGKKIDGLPTSGNGEGEVKDGGLGLRLGVGRENRDSMSSISTGEDSNGPRTPVEQPKEREEWVARGGILGRSSNPPTPTATTFSAGRGGMSPARERRQVIVKEETGEEVSVIPFPKLSPEREPIQLHSMPMITSPTASTLSPPPPTPANLTSFSEKPVKPPVINPRHVPRSGPSLGLRRQPSSSLQLEIPGKHLAGQYQHHHFAHHHAGGALTPGAAWRGYDSVQQGDRPTTSMIRKKSGELVKPSLKQRSLSTPHLPLRGSYGSTKSEPPTPSVDGSEYGGGSKNVRFAGGPEDGADSRLENVVLFSREQKVTAVSRAADGTYDGQATETETENDTDYVNFRTRRNAAAAAADEAEKVVFSEFSTTVPRVRCDFTPFRSEEDKARLREERVILERVELPGSGETLAFRGNVLVKNVAFRKWVGVRFTMDHWQTVSEVSGTHVVHIPTATTQDEGWDRFSFTIKLDDLKRKIEEKELLMCIRFSVDGQEWWDSNNGQNYRFGFKRTKPARPSRMSGISSRLGSDSQIKTRQTPLPTPPLPGMKGSSFGRVTGWAFPTSPKASPGGSPMESPLYESPVSASPVQKPTRPAVSSLGAPRPAFVRADTPLPTSTPTETPPTDVEEEEEGSPRPTYPTPSVADILDHLKLKTYCAPAGLPPLSPPKDGDRAAPPGQPMSPPRGRTPTMSLIGGAYAHLSPEIPVKGHERRRSWNGDASDLSGWGEEEQEEPGSPASSTETIMNAKDLSIEDSAPQAGPPDFVSGSGEDRSMSVGGGLHSAMDLITPPQSAVSSPPQPLSHTVPESPSPSTASTSPTSSQSSPTMEHTFELPEVVIDGDERDKHGERTVVGNSYQDFIDKYCFYRSDSDVRPTSPHRPSHSTSSIYTAPLQQTYISEYPPAHSYPYTTRTGPAMNGGYGSGPDTYFPLQPPGVTWGSGRRAN